MKFTEANGLFYDGEHWYKPIEKDGLIILEPIPEKGRAGQIRIHGVGEQAWNR